MNHLFGKKKEPVKKEATATEAVTKLKEVRHSRLRFVLKSRSVRPSLNLHRARGRSHSTSHRWRSAGSSWRRRYKRS